MRSATPNGRRGRPGGSATPVATRSSASPQPSAAAASAGMSAATQREDIQNLVLFSRCWRFVRVGHGIATSINDIVRAKVPLWARIRVGPHHPRCFSSVLCTRRVKAQGKLVK